MKVYRVPTPTPPNLLEVYHEEQGRPDWRNPDMPCWKDVTFRMQNGQHVTFVGYARKEFMTADASSRMLQSVPSYQSDPTYYSKKNPRPSRR